MTAVSGANLRSGEAYWELSGPLPINRVSTCRACKKTIAKVRRLVCLFVCLLFVCLFVFLLICV